MSQEPDTSDARIELETVDLAREKADSVDYLNEYLLVAEWTTPRGYEQTATITWDCREGAWAVATIDGDERLVKLYDDFDGALDRFEDCLEQAEKNKSVAYA
ncbi:hypothetical protein [Halorussus marinus]|uniref:hypothetical protein n=1 Tax=Halorussus marinus TaxID=2505976 RepID=UPI00106DDF0A|nr:hypothetical protein [Halorussus marinus]